MSSTTWQPNPAAEEQAALWAARLDGSVLSAADRVALDAWLAEHPSHRSLLSSYCQFSADLEQQLPLLEGIKEGTAERRTAPATALPFPWLRWPRLAGVALTAAVAVALALWLGGPATQQENLATPVAERRQLTLADGTRLELNAQTAAVVQLSRTERRVRLASGQAFFSVSKDPDRPFVVETPAGAVRVTGTQFDVRAEADLLAVTVAEGTVQVRPSRGSPNVGTPVTLTAGKALAAGAGGVDVVSLTAPELDARLAWRQGYIVCAGTPLGEALERFARYHGSGIRVDPDAAALRVGGRYKLDDLNGFLVTIEDVLPVQISRDLNGTVHVGKRLPQ